MSKHTPGPWKIRVDSHGNTNVEAPATHGLVYLIATDVGGQVRKDKRGKWTDKSEVKANARLIAAAPELLEALIETLQSLEYVQRAHPEVSGIAKRIEDMRRARAAIAKATGAQP